MNHAQNIFETCMYIAGKMGPIPKFGAGLTKMIILWKVVSDLELIFMYQKNPGESCREKTFKIDWGLVIHQLFWISEIWKRDLKFSPTINSIWKSLLFNNTKWAIRLLGVSTIAPKHVLNIYNIGKKCYHIFYKYRKFYLLRSCLIVAII